jgi:hypothetical protein
MTRAFHVQPASIVLCSLRSAVLLSLPRFLSSPRPLAFDPPFPLSLWGVWRGKVLGCHTIVYRTRLPCSAMLAARGGFIVLRLAELYMYPGFTGRHDQHERPAFGWRF